jgi:hypothetical protein
VVALLVVSYLFSFFEYNEFDKKIEAKYFGREDYCRKY